MWIEKKEEDQDSTGQNTLENPSIGSGAGAAPVQVQNSSSAATGNMSSTNPDPVAPGQQFGTIQDYFKGNQQQGEKLGQDFNAKLDTAKQKGQQEIGEAANTARGEVANNTIGFDQNIVNSAVSDPTKVAGNQTDYDKFQQQWNAEYKGPQSFEDTAEYDTAAKAAGAAKSKAEQVGSAGGRQQMLQDEFKVYGAGNQGLDEALIQQSSEFNKIGDKAKELSSLQDYLGQQSQDIASKAQQAKDTTQQTKSQAQGAFSGALTNFQKDLNSRVQTVQDKINANQTTAKAYKDALDSRDPNKIAQTIKNIGLNAADQATIMDYVNTTSSSLPFKASLSGNYNYNTPTVADTAAVATKEDYDKAAALQKLTGVDYGGVLNQNDASKAGTFAVGDPNAGLNVDSLKSNLRQYLIDKQIQQSQGKPVDGGGTGDKHDPKVNVSPFQFQGEIQLSPNASAGTVKTVTDTLYTPLSGAGSYHEGSVYDAIDRVEKLVGLYKSGQITPEEYVRYATPIIQYARTTGNQIAGSGSKPANSVNPGLARLQQYLPVTTSASNRPGQIGIPKSTTKDPITGLTSTAY